jgi:hypothetical protein
MYKIKYPERLAARKARRAKLEEEGSVARAEYLKKQQAEKDKLCRLREARLAREQLTEI